MYNLKLHEFIIRREEVQKRNMLNLINKRSGTQREAAKQTCVPVSLFLILANCSYNRVSLILCELHGWREHCRER